MNIALAMLPIYESADVDEIQGVAPLQHNLRELKESLREEKETIEAFRTGDVDVIVIQGMTRGQVYTLENDERLRHRLIDQIGEGVLTLIQHVATLMKAGRLTFCSS